MEVHLDPDVEARLHKMAAESGRAAEDLMQDAMEGYLDELARVRDMLDTRYDEIKSGKVKLIDGDEVFAELRAKSETLRNPPR